MKLALGRLGSAGNRTAVQRAISLLRRFGTDAHLWLPGVGTINGLTTGNYLESTGNTLLTVDNPAGLVLDALGTVGSEEISDTGFDDTSKWNKGTGWSVSGGAAVYAGTSAFSQIANIGASVPVGATALVTFTVASAGTNVTSIRIVMGGALSVARSISGAGTYSCHAVNLGSFTEFSIQGGLGGGAVDAFSLSSIFVREVSGIHATQATTASKPILRRGLTNLLTYSSDFSQASWNKTRTSFAAGKLSASVDTGSHYLRVDTFSTVTSTFSFYVKAGEETVVALGNANASACATFNLATGVVSGVNANRSASIEPMGDGWYCCAFVSLGGTDTSWWYLSLRGNLSSYTGDGTSGVYIDRALLTPGTLTAQQILDAGGIPTTTTAAASNPAAGRYSWACDATDLLTATFPAGYESVTVIDAKSTGQVTTAAANIVGSYSIGPSYTSYGRIVVKGSLTASELTLLQGFANKLAGL